MVEETEYGREHTAGFWLLLYTQLQRKFFPRLWLVIVVLCVVYIVVRMSDGYQFDSRITALLPQQQVSKGALLAEQSFDRISSNRLVFLIESENRLASLQAARKFIESLDSSGVFSRVHGNSILEQDQIWQDFFWPRRYQLVTGSNKNATDDELVHQALGRLYSPLASVVAKNIVDDPLQLFFRWQTEQQLPTAFTTIDGWLSRVVDGRYYRMVLADFSGSPYQLDRQQDTLAAIQQAQSELSPDVRVLRSGLLLHAAHGAEQAIDEISTIGLGSVIGIVLLLLLVFRSISSLFLAFVPIVIGCIFALTVSLLVFDRLHFVTLAFGAGLVGVAIDYSMHYLCASHGTTVRSGSVLRKIFPSLSLGLVSSVLAYAAQGLAPFPGLRQMAFFSVSGLFGAWLTVVLWLPGLHSKPIKVSRTILSACAFSLRFFPSIERPVVRYFFIVLAVVLVFIVSGIERNDDLGLLQTSTQEMVQESERIDRLVAGASPGRYFVVRASDEQALLVLEENFSQVLQEAITRGWITGFQSVSRFVPSAETQKKNIQWQERRIYNTDGALSRFVAVAGISSLEEKAKQSFSTAKNEGLTIKHWLGSPVSDALAHLWLGQSEGGYYSIMGVSGLDPSLSPTQLHELTEGYPGVLYVDRVDNIGNLLAEYRQQLNQWLFMAYLLVFFLLFARYRKDTWRIIAPPAFASLLALSVLQVFGSPITLFHELALLLVLGIGVDASIFLRDSKASAHTWLAISLSSSTTLLAFGLLGVSKTPVLQYFGETLFFGIIGLWVITPCCIRSVHTSYHHNNL